MNSNNNAFRGSVTQWRGELALLLLCLFLFFWRLGAARLFDMDEGFYVSAARQMVVRGDWTTPLLNVRPHARPADRTVPFFEKPILTYWAAAGAMRGFGISEGAARLPAAAASFIATWLIVLVGGRWVGRRAALLAGLAYATAPMVILDARQMTTDALLTLWFLVAMIAGRERKPALFAVACALGVLTKGIIGLLLPLLVFAVLHAARWAAAGWHGQAFRWRPRISRGDWMRLALGAVLFLAITVPWHAAMLRGGGIDANGRTWVEEYLIRQHVGRFKGADVHHNAPIFTYVVYFLIGFFPWACFTPFAFRLPPRRDALARTCAPRPSDEEAETRRFLLCWFWTVFGFFSISAAKLPTYIVPAYAAALMVGQWLERALRLRAAQRASASPSPTGADEGGTPSVDTEVSQSIEAAALRRGLVRGALAALITSALLLAATLVVPEVTRSRPVMAPTIASLSIALALIATTGCLAAWLCLRRAARGSVWVIAGAAALTCTMAALIFVTAGPGYALINRWLLAPYQDLAILARDDARQGAPVVYYGIGDRRPSMLYYARDYSPLERKETPLLPFLLRYMPPRQQTADIVTLRKTYDRQLRDELAAADWTVEEIARRDSGLDTWMLLRIHPPVRTALVMKRPPPAVRHTIRRSDP